MTRTSMSGTRARGILAIAGTVVVISVLHYVTSLHSIVLHEVFKRLYYVPIVVAAVTTGTRAGLLTSVFATLLYLPHVALQWHAWTVAEAEQYGEILMFNVVAAVTGMLADRLHAERRRYQEAAKDLQNANIRIRAGEDDRLRIERLVTIGRVASGIAHEIRTPLATLLGCFEILASDFQGSHPKAEFVSIAKAEITRLDRLVAEFLDFVYPPPPVTGVFDLTALAEATAVLARPVLTSRSVRLDVIGAPTTVAVQADGSQVQRALLSVLTACVSTLNEGLAVLSVHRIGETGQLCLEFEGRGPRPVAWDVFEPFPGTVHPYGLALATARRLIENQHGTIQSDVTDGRLRCVITLPVADSLSPDAVTSQVSAQSHAGSALQ